MPLERKILLSILISIMLVFSFYFLYTGYYLEYKKNTDRIIKYEKLIRNFTPVESVITREVIDGLLKRETTLENYFTDERDLEGLTSHIKSLLLSEDLTISQFNPGEKTVRFLITGNKDQLRLFLYSLSKEPLSLYVPMFSIRMVDNQNISGILEVGENIKSEEPKNGNMLKSLRKLFRQTTYRESLLSYLGLDIYLESEQGIIVITEEEEVVPEALVSSTDKFQFVGILKKENHTETMFKEKSHGRIYRFENGETISEWTFIGKEINRYVFEKDGKRYEVKD